MTKSNSLKEDAPPVLIKKSYLAICKDNHCAAALLSYFEYRHCLVADCKKNGLWPETGLDKSYKDFLQPCPMSVLEEAMLGLFKEKAIRTALSVLKELELISTHKNPNATHLDNTLYVLFHARILAEFLT